jgi:hypothetical protein
LPDADAPAQLELAGWCRQQGLTREADYHYQLALALDPGNTEAHRALGHARGDGRWLTTEELMESHGLVRYGNRWVEPGEAARLQRDDMQAQLEAEWRRRIGRLVLRVQTGGSESQARATQEFLAIADPMATSALNERLTDRDPEVRRLALTVIEKQGLRGGVEELVELAVGTDGEEVRALARSALVKVGGERALKLLIGVLGGIDEDRCRYAALALGELGDRRAVPSLIDAIRRDVVISGLGPLLGGQRRNGLGAVVAPSSTRGGSPALIPAVGREARMQIRTIENGEAVEALELLTGLQYGDDQMAWRAWWIEDSPSFLRGVDATALPADLPRGGERASTSDIKEE